MMLSGDAEALYPNRAGRSRPREEDRRRAVVEPWLCGCREWQIDAVSDSLTGEDLRALVLAEVERHVLDECAAHTIPLPEQPEVER